MPEADVAELTRLHAMGVQQGDETTVFHVGYVKTASTFLQRRVFGRADLGVEHAFGDRTRALLVEKFVLADGYVFSPEAVRADLNAASLSARQRGSTVVWSDETLLGDPIARRYDGPAILERLVEVVPDARILITIREQVSAAHSIYHEYRRLGGLQDFDSFFGTGEEQMSFSSVLRSSFLEYDRAISRYHECFGKNRVFVLPVEMLRLDPSEYMARLSECLDRDVTSVATSDVVHGQQGNVSLRLRRRLNFLMQRDPLRPGLHGFSRLVDRSISVLDRLVPRGIDEMVRRSERERLHRRYAGAFSESNRRSAELTGLPLTKLGYQT